MKRRTGSGIAHQAVSLDSNATQQQQQHHHHHHHHHSPISKSERFMERLVEKVKGILESAVQNDDRSRLTILNEFFSNISCRVEDEVLLYLESDHHRAESKRSIPSTSSNPPPSEIGSRHHHEHEHDTYDLHEHERDPGTDHELDPDPDHDTEHHDDHEQGQDQHQDLGINATEHATSYHSIFNDANNDDSNESNDNVGDKFTKDITTTITTTTGTRCLDNKNNSASNSNSDGDSEVNESHYNSDADGDSDSDTASNSSSLSLDLPPPVSSDILLLSQSINPLATSTTPAPALVNPPPPLISGTSEANNEFSSSVPTAPDLSLAVSPSSIPLTSSPVVSTSSTPSPPSPNPAIQSNASSIIAASTSSIPPSGAPRTPSTPTAPSPTTHTPPIFYASSAPSSASPSSSSSASSSVSQGMATSTGTVEGSNSTTTRERVPMMYYYELLAERFATHPTDVTALLQVIVSLWSNPTFPIIFAALFYKWMFRHDVQMKNFNLFIKGANRLFWLDLETINTRFAPIYKLLNNEVLASYSNVHNNKGSAPLPLSPSPPAMNGSVLSRFLLDFFNVLGRFFFYYQKVSDLPLFIEKAQAIFSSSRNHSEINPYPPLPPNTTNAPNTSNTITKSTNTYTTSDDSSNIVTIASTDISAQNTAPTHKQLAKISAADNLVDCTIRQIKLIKNEYVLVKYIQKCVHFRGLALTDTTQVKLQTLLYDYTSPGGPSYPPRSVRHAATESLDALFPTGKLPRRYIHLFFRLLHPYYATRSIVHWLYPTTKQNKT